MKKIKILLIFILFIALINTVKTTYSRYATSTESTVSLNLARWEISVNNADITSNTNNTMTITPIIDANANVMANKIAPGSTGYFDILINPTNVDVSFSYTITATPNNTVADLKITNYEKIDNNNQEVINDNYSNNITENVLYNNSPFEPFTIRVHFKWIDDETETMDDDEDTNIVRQVNNNENINPNINVNINFNQYIQNTD